MEKKGEEIKCKLCGKKFKAITYKHLKHHNITLSEYKVKYGETLSEGSKKLTGRTLKNYIKKFGLEEGTVKFKAYCQKHKYKNTFAAKKAKYGWSKEEFKTFNKTRAVTLKNCILRHGKIKGQQIFNDYCKKQKTAGISKEYFINKLGLRLGEEKYKEICLKKGHTLENYKKRYGKHANQKLATHYSKLKNNGVSKIELEFSEQLTKKMNQTFSNIIFTRYNNKGRAFATVAEKNKVYMYDYVIVFPIKLCIEFNGDYWHANPKKYTADTLFTFNDKTAKQIWDEDKKKLAHIKTLGFKTLVIWESDYRQNKERNINKCLKKITKLLKSKKLLN